MKGFIESISEMSGIPADTILGYRYIVINGKGIFIEGIKSIRDYSETGFTALLKKGSLAVSGTNLIIKHLNKDEVMVLGNIEKVENNIK